MLGSSFTSQNCSCKAFLPFICLRKQPSGDASASLQCVFQSCWHYGIGLAWSVCQSSQGPAAFFNDLFTILLLIFKVSLANGHFYLCYTFSAFSNLVEFTVLHL